ncbi:hypothetical protein HMPREF0682_1127 [Propionibacterium acidifaciens F0233]|uniref:Uncharacterized protein n=1 Tax=Propionibacterium acidifaciens F0233 TaxID=553198 RepID=U2R5E9_9ACTN|nr:hypothetical protein HMPREF0682_1127 [Propionibacterium acidifaciens F0233]
MGQRPERRTAVLIVVPARREAHAIPHHIHKAHSGGGTPGSGAADGRTRTIEGAPRWPVHSASL